MAKRTKDEDNLINSLDKEVVKYLDEYIFRLVDDAYSEDADLRDKIFMYRLFYGMESPPKTLPFDGCSNMMFDYVQSKVTGYLARLKEVLAVPPTFEVDPFELKDTEMCLAREKFLEYKMTEPCYSDITRNVKDCLFNEVALEAVLTGTGILHNTFMEDMQTETGIEIVRSADDLTEFFGERNAKKQFADTYQSLMAQENNIVNGKSNLITPEQVPYDYDVEIKQHFPRCIKREDFVITSGAESLEKATIHGCLFNTTWNSLITSYKDGYLSRVPFIANSTEENSLRDEEIDDIDNDYAKEYWERTDIEMFVGIVWLDLAMIKKLAKMKDQRPVITDEDDDADPDEFFAGMKKYKVFMSTDSKRIVRLERYRPYHQRSEFYPLYIKKIPGVFNGIGQGQLLSQYLIESNKLFNMFSDGNLLDIMPIFRVPTGTDFSPNRFPVKPYAVWESDIPIEKIAFNTPNANNTLLLLQQIQKRGDTISVPEILTGKESSIDPNAPASKTAMMIKQSNINLGEGIELFSKYMKPIAYNMIEELYQFGDEQMEYRVMDDKAKVLWKEMDKKDLALKADYRVRGKSEDLNKIIAQTKTVEDYKILVQDPIVAERVESRRQLLVNIARARDIENVENILPSKEDIEKENMKREALALIDVLQKSEAQKAQQSGEEMQETLGRAKQSAEVAEIAKQKLIEGAGNGNQVGYNQEQVQR